jgi:hypothetical protein
VRLEHDALAVLEHQPPYRADALREEETFTHATAERVAQVALDTHRNRLDVHRSEDALRQRPVERALLRVMEERRDGAAQRGRRRHDLSFALVA